LKLTVVAYSIDGKKSIIVEKSGNKNDPINLGKLAGKELHNQGVSELAINWREKVEEWNKK
jgi:hydroxymethylbilane synthase